MKLNHLFERGKPTFSLEIFPPKKDSAIEGIYRTLEELTEIKPDFISVTYGAGGGEAGATTCELASHIKHQLGIEPLAHFTCVNSTRRQ
ncbi:MAG: methylenetetrahydrofolate reductase, partial [Oscillospiraceae bacterium]|nr:methylenetetrahydrofolate reductase [Oscillospiraceae bacterium]